ncbi:uncharacterized protein LOC142232535 [Haematobia irritans]|uniref:uncharacterized protein LOC142232535 n=1 Tax=Haematobia irritans TaxID=7368 RepID=UPI003F4F9064
MPATKSKANGRAIGGVLIGVSLQLADSGITISDKKVGGILIIELHSKDTIINLIPIYLRPASWDKDFYQLQNIFLDTNVINPILIGDFNGRIGEYQQELDLIYAARFRAGLEARRTKDTIINRNGKLIIEFITDNNMIILNGRTNGDEEGNLTYISHIGESVIDICSVSNELLNYIESFQIENKVWSDHMPVVLTIKLLEIQNSTKTLNLLPKLWWKDKYTRIYQRNLNRISEYFSSNVEAVSFEKLSEAIKKSAVEEKSAKKFTQKKKWYDFECNVARQKSFKYLNEYRKTGKIQDKEKYLVAQKTYKTICNNCKTRNLNKLISNINSIKSQRDWWNTAKEIRNQRSQIGTNITADDFLKYFQALLNPRQSLSEISYAQPHILIPYLDDPITMSELKSILKTFKYNKAPGEDRIPYEFLMNATDNFHTLLLKKYNESFESNEMDESFSKTIIFPIHKKGNVNETSNYRGIAFSNCIVKIMMGILNERLSNWVESQKLLTEYQCGFRRGYSTTDNIYNLASIVSLKFKEKKKVYCFFVDFKAAFDKIERKALIYKLFEIGLSYKLVKFIEKVYSKTHYAVWTGEQISEYFATTTGLKQGCLLSPLLFALYINDIHDELQGGLYCNSINISVLLYADDMVVLADDPGTMQQMINNLEKYCNKWNLEVNMHKSEIMVFRKGGRLGQNEKWWYNGVEIRVTNEYKYLGVVFTPKMSFTKHLEKRNMQAKNALNITWESIMRNPQIHLPSKWKVYQAVCRAIQSYSAQVWGFGNFEEVDKLQRFFIKKVLNLPKHTPNYALMLETAAEESHIYTLSLHIKYIEKILVNYSDRRLPKLLTNILLHQEVFWVKELKLKVQYFSICWPNMDNIKEQWNMFGNDLLIAIKLDNIHKNMERKSRSGRLYRDLNYFRGLEYISDENSLENIGLIFRARCRVIPLSGNKYGATEQDRLCNICNLGEPETLQHFLGVCPGFREFRLRYFQKTTLNTAEIIGILNGDCRDDWLNLVKYLKLANNYRQFLVNQEI